MARLIAITGGIGSGKSVVSRILSAMGLDVYDTDSNAKRLMNTSAKVIAALRNEFGSGVYTPDGVVDRAYLAELVFADRQKLQALNRVVHPAVARDVKGWADSHSGNLAFVETALLHASGLELIVDGVWRVDAPVTTRVARVMNRNGLSAKAVTDRIEAQRSEEVPFAGEQVIVNDGERAVLPQVVCLLKKWGLTTV